MFAGSINIDYSLEYHSSEKLVQSDQNMMIPGIHVNFSFEVSSYSGQAVKNNLSPIDYRVLTDSRDRHNSTPMPWSVQEL